MAKQQFERFSGRIRNTFTHSAPAAQAAQAAQAERAAATIEEHEDSAEEKTPSQARRFFTSKWTISTAVVAIVAGLAIGLVTAFCPPVGLAALAMGLASLYAAAGVAAMGLAIATFATAAAAAVLLIGALLKGTVVVVKRYQESSKDHEHGEEEPGHRDAHQLASTRSSSATMTTGLGVGVGVGVGGAAAAEPLHFTESPAVTPGRRTREQSGSDEFDTGLQQPLRVAAPAPAPK